MYSLRGEKKPVKVLLVVSCTLFFLVCLYSILKSGNTSLLGNLDKPNNDDVKFIRSAWILAQTGIYSYHNPPHPTAFMMPGVSYTLAFFMLIFGKFGGITAFRIIQAVLQTGSLLLVFFIGRQVFNSKVAITAVVINALYFADVWVANLILTETFFKFFTLNLVYFSILAIQEKKSKLYILAGIAWGLAYLFRPTSGAYFLIILLMWILNKYSLKEMAKYAAISATIFCIVVSPWWIRNYQVFHQFIPATLANGNPFLQGTYINYDQRSMATDGLNYKQFKYPTNSEITNNIVEMDIAKYRLKNLVPKQPLQFFLWYTVGKAIRQIDWPFYWVPFLGISYFVVAAYHYLILFAAILGIWTYFRANKKSAMGTLILATIVYFIIFYLLFFAFSRYFYPAMPLVIIFAAYTVTNLLVKIQQKAVLKKQINSCNC